MPGESELTQVPIVELALHPQVRLNHQIIILETYMREVAVRRTSIHHILIWEDHQASFWIHQILQILQQTARGLDCAA